MKLTQIIDANGNTADLIQSMFLEQLIYLGFTALAIASVCFLAYYLFDYYGR